MSVLLNTVAASEPRRDATLPCNSGTVHTCAPINVQNLLAVDDETRRGRHLCVNASRMPASSVGAPVASVGDNVFSFVPLIVGFAVGTTAAVVGTPVSALVGGSVSGACVLSFSVGAEVCTVDTVGALVGITISSNVGADVGAADLEELLMGHEEPINRHVLQQWSQNDPVLSASSGLLRAASAKGMLQSIPKIVL